MKTVLIIIAQKGYQDIELEGTRKGLTEAGFAIAICSKERGTCTGKYGGKEEAAVSMREVNVEDYDRFAFIGGPGANTLRDDPEATNLAHRASLVRRPLGAICIAPTILAAAGVLKSKKATVWNNNDLEGAYLENHGAQYVPEHVVVDGLTVTADGPDAALEFGKALAAV